MTEKHMVKRGASGLLAGLAAVGILLPAAGGTSVAHASSIRDISSGTSTSCTMLPLGAATSFSAFTLGNFNYQNDDEDGAVAAGGNMIVSRSRLASDVSALPSTQQPGTNYTVVVGGNLSLLNSSVAFGTVAYGGTYSAIGFPAYSGINSTSAVQSTSVVDFAQASTQLPALSSYYGALPTTDSAQVIGGILTLSTATTGLHVYNIAMYQLSSVSGIAVSAPVGATILINDLDSSLTFNNKSFTVNGVYNYDQTASAETAPHDFPSVLLNMPNATMVSIGGTQFQGSILAPRADATLGNDGSFWGTIVFKDILPLLYGDISAEPETNDRNLHQFTGCLPPPVLPTATPTAVATSTAVPTSTAVNLPTSTPAGTPINYCDAIATAIAGWGSGNFNLQGWQCTATPSPTVSIPTCTPTRTPINTVVPTSTPTNTVVPTNTPTNTAAPTKTPCPPTNTPVPSNTPINTPSPTKTPCPPTNTPTNTAVPTNTPTNTAVPTNTPTNTAVPTNTPTNTAVPTNTPTNTAVPTNTPTNTAVPTNTPTNTAVPTNTPTNTAVPTNTPTNTAVPTNTPTNTAVPTNTPTNTAVPTNTPTNTAVPTNTPTNTAVPTNTPTNTAVPTNTPTNTAVPTNTPTNTAVPTNTPTNTAVPTNTPTNTAVPTNTPTNTAVPTNTPTNTVVPTNTPTNTAVPTTTPTNTPTNTATSVPTLTPTSTATSVPTGTVVTVLPPPTATMVWTCACIIPTPKPICTPTNTPTPTSLIVNTSALTGAAPVVAASVSKLAPATKVRTIVKIVVHNVTRYHNVARYHTVVIKPVSAVQGFQYTHLPMTGKSATAIYRRYPRLTAEAPAAGSVSIQSLGIQNAPLFSRAFVAMPDGSLEYDIAPQNRAITQFNYSAAIGARGLSVLFAHDDIRGSVFAPIAHTKKGAIVKISIHGQTYRYMVKGIHIVSPSDTSILDARYSSATLAMVSCTPTGIDTQRVIVIATLMK